MAELSPAAQAVLDAYINAPCGKPRRTWVAAALRAAADQVECTDPDDNAFAAGYDTALDDILAIAAELEGNQATGSTHLEVGDE